MSPMKSKQVVLSQCCRKSPGVLRLFLHTSRKTQVKELDVRFPGLQEVAAAQELLLPPHHSNLN